MAHPPYDENPVNLFASNYSIPEKIDWLIYRTLNPSRRYHNLSEFLPQSTVLNPVTPKLKVAFTGDVMPVGQLDLVLDEPLQQFYADADFWVVNLEGIVYPKERWLALAHKEKIVKALQRYFPPERTLITCANNHTGDFGFKNFQHSYDLLKEAGFHVIGRKDENSFLLPHNIHLTCASKWSNQICPYMARLEDAQYNPEANFNILVYHWGYEMHLYPNPGQIELARELLTQYDALIGHHSHCPQPVTQIDNRLIAYSLGNFCTKYPNNNHRYGIAMKMDIGPTAENEWKTGAVEYAFTRNDFRPNKVMEVSLHNSFRY